MKAPKELIRQHAVLWYYVLTSAILWGTVVLWIFVGAVAVLRNEQASRQRLMR